MKTRLSLAAVHLHKSQFHHQWHQLEKVLSIKSSLLTRIEIQSSLTSIGCWAFSWCISITQITIPPSITSIEDHTFFYCSSLPQITIPLSISTIGWHAFSNCSKLTRLQISQYKHKYFRWNRDHFLILLKINPYCFNKYSCITFLQIH